MKRITSLALIVLALAVVPAALADDTTPPAQQPANPAHAGGHANLRLRLEIMRVRVQLVRLRFRLHCGPNGNAPQERCVAFAQKVEDRLTAFDSNLQKKIDDLKACTSDSTEAMCKNADTKIELLTTIDARVQAAIQDVQTWIDGNGAPTMASSSTGDSALDQAAADLSQAAAGSSG